MVYVTGDMHGDISRFQAKEIKKLKKNDTLIICGDFGFLWDGSPKEKRLLKWIGRRRFHVLFVDGVHDNMQLLSGYPIERWNGGETRHIFGKLRYLCRGHIFDLEGQKVFAFGGGEPPLSGTGGLHSSACQMPSRQEIIGAKERLAAYNNQVDYIITHQSSRKMKKLLTMEENEANVLDTFFDELRASCKYKNWLFGSFHTDMVIPPCETALFEKVVPLGSPIPFVNTKSISIHTK